MTFSIVDFPNLQGMAIIPDATHGATYKFPYFLDKAMERHENNELRREASRAPATF